LQLVQQSKQLKVHSVSVSWQSQLLILLSLFSDIILRLIFLQCILESIQFIIIFSLLVWIGIFLQPTLLMS